MVSWSNLEKLCSCSRTWMVSALACGNKWIQGGTYSFGRYCVLSTNHRESIYFAIKWYQVSALSLNETCWHIYRVSKTWKQNYMLYAISHTLIQIKVGQLQTMPHHSWKSFIGCLSRTGFISKYFCLCLSVSITLVHLVFNALSLYFCSHRLTIFKRLHPASAQNVS